MALIVARERFMSSKNRDSIQQYIPSEITQVLNKLARPESPELPAIGLEASYFIQLRNRHVY